MGEVIMKRLWLNFSIDLISFLNLLCLIFTGLVMKFILPPGTGGLGRHLHDGSGRGVRTKELWLMGRHEWGGIHFYLAFFFIVLMVIHVILHWGWIKGCFKSLFCSKSLQ